MTNISLDDNCNGQDIFEHGVERSDEDISKRNGVDLPVGYGD